MPFLPLGIPFIPHPPDTYVFLALTKDLGITEVSVVVR